MPISSEKHNYQVGVTKQWNIEPSATPLAPGRHAKLVADGLKPLADFVGL